jgi:hypothetical protein
VFNGAIVCRLVAESPVAVGGRYEQSKPIVQVPYRRTYASVSDRREALPGSSVRGMLSSVLEAISKSSLRVLDNKRYKVRSGKGPTTYELFNRIDETGNLLPWNPKRNSLTPAESLFGVASDGAAERNEFLSSLASRIRVHDAIAVKGAERLPPVRLQILSTPKPAEVKSGKAPPSPPLYFKTNTGKPVTKSGFPEADVVPRGRKFYLAHADQATPKREAPWRSRAGDRFDNQRVQVEPFKAGCGFWCHIEFENLSSAELNLLLRSVEPSDDFKHQIGVGKPLGLGLVDIRIAALRLRNHSFEEYFPKSDTASAEALFSQPSGDVIYLREEDKCTLPENGVENALWASSIALSSDDANKFRDLDHLLEALCATEDSLIDSQALTTLLVLRTPNPDLPVCYPRVQWQLSAWLNGEAGDDNRIGDKAEGNLYKWTANNPALFMPILDSRAVVPPAMNVGSSGAGPNRRPGKKKHGRGHPRSHGRKK